MFNDKTLNIKIIAVNNNPCGGELALLIL